MKIFFWVSIQEVSFSKLVIRLWASVFIDDVLALGRSLDLRELVEDELLLALPIVPRHEVCLQPLPMAVGEQALEDDVPERPHPFAALQALKSGKGPGGKG